MKIAWLCPYPIQNIKNIPVRKKIVALHPATWITELSTAIIKYYPDTELHIISENQYISKDFISFQDGIHFHFMRSPTTIPVVYKKLPWPYPADLFFNYWLIKNKINRFLNILKPEIVHAHGTEAAYAYASLKGSFPAVISIQGIISEISKYSNKKRNTSAIKMEQYSIQRGQYFVAKTQFTKKFIEKYNKRAVIYEIGNCIPNKYLFLWHPSKPANHILFIGSIIKEKGIEDLIKALAYTPRRRLKIIGTGTRAYLSYLKLLSKNLKLDDRIEWLGYLGQTEIGNEFRSASMLVLPSYMETSPNVVMEAMAAGVPVVATKVGGIPDMVENGQTGYTFAPGNYVELAEKIDYVFNNPERMETIRRKAREIIVEKHDPQLIVNRIISMYSDIIKANDNSSAKLLGPQYLDK